MLKEMFVFKIRHKADVLIGFKFESLKLEIKTNISEVITVSLVFSSTNFWYDTY